MPFFIPILDNYAIVFLHVDDIFSLWEADHTLLSFHRCC